MDESAAVLENRSSGFRMEIRSFHPMQMITQGI